MAFPFYLYGRVAMLTCKMQWKSLKACISILFMWLRTLVYQIDAQYEISAQDINKGNNTNKVKKTTQDDFS